MAGGHFFAGGVEVDLEVSRAGGGGVAVGAGAWAVAGVAYGAAEDGFCYLAVGEHGLRFTIYDLQFTIYDF